MKVGDKIEIEVKSESKSALVVKEITFEEYCSRCDNLMIEYDIEDVWSKWKKSGPCFEVLHSGGELTIVWQD
tara:strand:- start:376 stop:591 length:216 start_codon:yes stop_codon:yes gene_type:complete